MAEAESSDQVLCATQDISGLSQTTRTQSRRNVSISGYYFLQKNEEVSLQAVNSSLKTEKGRESFLSL